MRSEFLLSLSSIWAISPEAANGMLPLVAAIIEGKAFVETEESLAKARNSHRMRFAMAGVGAPYAISDYGIAAPPEEAPENSVAILPIRGGITKFDQFCGPSGTETKADLLRRANANPNIKSILLNIDSPGGEGLAAFGLAEVIRNEVTKPIVALVDDLSASAAYLISTAADRIVAKNNVSRIGSIGTYVTVADFEEYWKSKGIKITEVYATASTEKNKGYRDAIKGDFTALRESVDEFNESFLATVESYRGEGLKSDRGTWGTGKVFSATDALKHGLVDEIDSFNNTLQSLIQL